MSLSIDLTEILWILLFNLFGVSSHEHSMNNVPRYVHDIQIFPKTLDGIKSYYLLFILLTLDNLI